MSTKATFYEKNQVSNLGFVELLDLFIILLFGCFLLVDSINGYLLKNGLELPFSVSQVYKTLMMGFMIFRIQFYGAYSRMITIILIGCLIPLPLIRYLYFSGEYVFKEDFLMYFRFLMLPVSYFYFKGFIRKYADHGLKLVRKALIFNVFILVANLVLGILGFGFQQYHDIGTTGFFYAGNEVSAVVVILFGYLLFETWEHKRRWFFPLAFVLLVLSVFKATKSAMLGVVLMTFIIPLISERNKLFKLTFLKIRLSWIYLIVGSLLVVVGYQLIESSGLMGRWLYFYDKHGSIQRLIFSEREEFVIYGLDMFKSYDLFEMLFGQGYYNFQRGMIEYVGKMKTTEIDFFDILFSSGILGVFIIFSFYLSLLYMSFKLALKSNNKYAPFVFCVNLLMIFISFFSGHILFSGLALIFIGLFNSLRNLPKASMVRN